MLHVLREDARARLCRDYRSWIADRAAWQLEGYVEAYLDHSTRTIAFSQPAAQAALDLGADEFREQIDAGRSAQLAELTATLRLLVPEMSESVLQAMARAACRVALGVLFDRDCAPDEYRVQLRALIARYTPGRAREQPLLGTLAC